MRRFLPFVFFVGAGIFALSTWLSLPYGRIFGSSFLSPGGGSLLSPDNINSTTSTIKQLNFTGATGTNLALTSLHQTQVPYVTSSGVLVGDNNFVIDTGDIGFGPTLGLNGTVSSSEGFFSKNSVGATSIGDGSLAASVNTFDGSNYLIFLSTPAGKAFAVRDDIRVDVGPNVDTTTHAQIIFKDYDSTSGSPKILLNNNITSWSAIGNNQVGDIILGTSPDVNDWAHRWLTVERSDGALLPEKSNLQNIGSPTSSWANVYVSGTVFAVNVSSTQSTSTNFTVLGNLEVGSGSAASNIVTNNKPLTFLNMNVGTNSSTLINNLIGPTSHIFISDYGATSTIKLNTTTTGVATFRPVNNGAVVNNGATNEFSVWIINTP